jgi:hypothetical protein
MGSVGIGCSSIHCRVFITDCPSGWKMGFGMLGPAEILFVVMDIVNANVVSVYVAFRLSINISCHKRHLQRSWLYVCFR